MTSAQEAPRRARLNRDAVLHTAVALADRAGIDGLTMRTLAQELGVVPMALYKHVANKEQLLDGMVDIVWSEVELPTSDDGWRAGMRRRSVSLRDALSRHRWAIGLMESRMSPGPANLRQHNAMMGCLRSAGFSFRTTVHSTSTLDAYIYGFALQEKTMPFETPEQSGEVAQAQLEAQEAAAALYPYLVEVVVELAKAGYDGSAEFEIGLDLILDGIEKLRPEWISAD
ncbi:TetR/AcrR family transcriptional regulator C-terminal domain-containing protein [Naasia sp. SYSU D00057]|uniref:TetR/AcrR family transcriptional regulator C-terminal domain-containing protein n=1 Tax=Naasia sp. SYSU D00057 TaxID=2817380 RepID=UPI0027DC91FE|nr:TetR/AcrR family transcriptional regulator C-terminal domain-containing protein [Naasia sp. SYSU D00057]